MHLIRRALAHVLAVIAGAIAQLARKINPWPERPSRKRDA
jgi:hypothetical protein